MFNPWIALASALIAYLIGSISTARIFTSKLAPGADLQKVDLAIEGVASHRIKTVGATTASIILGPKSVT
jgi:glycerol-3-phosphate acyltransferase PlsY